MSRAIGGVLVLLATPELFVQVPLVKTFSPAKLIKSDATPAISTNTFDIREEVFAIDEDGRIQETEFRVQGLSPPAPPPRKK